MAASSEPGAGKEVVIARTFDAPRDLVFRAWTDPEHVGRWWGPREFTNSVAEWDARPGGRIRLDMIGPDGTPHPMKGVFHEVTPTTRLVFTSTAMEDAKGTPQLEAHNTVTFAESGGKTTLTLRAVVVKATPEVAPALAGMEAGWTQSLDKLDTEVTGTADREIVVTRMFEAPRELVFDAWTNPEHVGRWWGPNGFTTTTSAMDVRPGGEWRYVMHGPDGRDYPNWVIYQEVSRPRRLVYDHGGEDDEPVRFRVTVTFAEMLGKTILTMRSVFPTGAERDRVVKKYGAEEGARQTLARLHEHLDATAKEAFVISRTFDAPRDLVYRAWTETEHLTKWFGPVGFTTTAAKNDPRPGGVFHYRMRSPTGAEMWGKWVYREVTPPERIAFVSSFSDAAGNTTRAPFSDEWPLEVLSVITFTEEGGKTTVTMRGLPINANEAERKKFGEMHGSMRGGWGGTLDQLAEYLAKM
jgi:uncharacterized protein YndB with AHSA1/START domain